MHDTRRLAPTLDGVAALAPVPFGLPVALDRGYVSRPTWTTWRDRADQMTGQSMPTGERRVVESTSSDEPMQSSLRGRRDYHLWLAKTGLIIFRDGQSLR